MNETWVLHTSLTPKLPWSSATDSRENGIRVTEAKQTQGTWGKAIPYESRIQGEGEIVKDVLDFRVYVCVQSVL